MKIQEIVFESYNHIIDEDEWLELVKRECQPYLNSRPVGEHLYRGYGELRHDDKTYPNFFKGKLRQQRKPLTTSPLHHNLMNNYFIQKFGQQFRNSIYTTGNLGFAERFGKLYAIFPIGNFSFLWSPNIVDFYSGRLPVPSSFIKRLFKSNRDLDQTKLNVILDKLNYTTENLAKAILSGNEIMIRCKEYYSILGDENVLTEL